MIALLVSLLKQWNKDMATPVWTMPPAVVYTDPRGYWPCPPQEVNPWYPKPPKIPHKDIAKGQVIGGVAGACASLAFLAVLHFPELIPTLFDLVKPRPRPYPVAPHEPIAPDVPEPWYPKPDDHVVPSIPEDLPPGLLPPYNPDDYGI